MAIREWYQLTMASVIIVGVLCSLYLTTCLLHYLLRLLLKSPVDLHKAWKRYRRRKGAFQAAGNLLNQPTTTGARVNKTKPRAKTYFREKKERKKEHNFGAKRETSAAGATGGKTCRTKENEESVR